MSGAAATTHIRHCGRNGRMTDKDLVKNGK